jgi:hypothetical protein
VVHPQVATPYSSTRGRGRVVAQPAVEIRPCNPQNSIRLIQQVTLYHPVKEQFLEVAELVKAAVMSTQIRGRLASPSERQYRKLMVLAVLLQRTPARWPNPA